MDWDSIEKKYPKGKRITVVISRVEEFGAFANLPDGIIGFIPRKELTWTGNIINARKIIKENQLVNVVIIEADEKYKNIRLSIREEIGDPWQKIDKEYQVGKIIEGIVIKVLEKTAYIDVEGKVEGVIYFSHIEFNADCIDELLIVDDKINAKIINIDHRNKILHLSLIELFINDENYIKKESTIAIGEIYQELFDNLNYNLEKEINREIGLNELAKERIKRILIVDPDEEISCSTALMLESFGFETKYALSAEESIKKYNESPVDFVLSALNMPHENGIYLARTLLSKNSKLPIAFQTAREDIENYLTELEEIGLQNCILPKPWNIKELVSLINDAADQVLGQTQFLFRSEDDFNLIDKLSISPDGQKVKRKTIDEMLVYITRKIKASFTIIFQLQLTTMETRVYNSCDWNNEIDEKDRFLLRFSPVKDVIYSNESLFVNNMIGDRYKYLKSLGHFASLIGERIDFNTEFGFGLFLFGNDEKQFSENNLKEVKNVLDIFAAALERNHLEEIIRKQHKFIVTGKLSSALIHEIKNEQQSLFNNIEILKTDSVNLNSGKIGGNDTKFLARFQRVVNSLLKEQQKIGKINRLFLNLFKEGNSEEIDLKEHLNELIQIIQPSADEEKIRIILSEYNIPKCILNSSRLDQVITNLLMNAIEHIPSIRKVSGKIWINLEYKKEDELPIKIEISDNGPGIHTIHLNKVFDIFFTTKNGGSGLGLFISQALIESMKGKISIKDTIRFKGTTFLIELPKFEKEV